MTTTANPTRCSLAQIADHLFVTVDARIAAIGLKHQDTRYPWAELTLTDGEMLVDVRVYSRTYALCSEHLQVGNRVVVSAEVAQDAEGVFMAAHTVHSAVSA